MKMTGDIRVRTDKKYRNLYNDLKNFVARDMHEIFFICACLGYTKGKKKPLGREGDDRFWSGTITPEEYASYYAMLIESKDMDFSVIADDKAVIAEMEKYANAGMEIVIDDLLDDYMIDKTDNLRLDPSCSKELPKILLAYIYEKTSEQNNKNT